MFFTRPFVVTVAALQLFSLTACGDKSADTNEDNFTCVSGGDGYDSLCGKTWFVIGDSFSMGDWAGVDPTPAIQDGRYKGKLPVYSYLIGNRTGMVVNNIAVNGSTMSMYRGSSVERSFTFPHGLLYTTDFSSADYITIYYGINDSNLEIPIGSMDDFVDTTFYGAYNITLDHLTRHFPQAKIGLIVSNGCISRDYPDATVEIAKKWGVPYLDLDGGVDGVTMLISSARNPASEEEKLKILEEQRISPTNNHPNEFAHELESRFIENWLRSL